MSERVALLQSALHALATPGVIPGCRRESLASFCREPDRAREGDRSTLSAGEQRAAEPCDARGGEAGFERSQRVLDRIVKEDQRLGAQRPEVVQALTSTVQSQLDNARGCACCAISGAFARRFPGYQQSVGLDLVLLVKAGPRWSPSATRRTASGPAELAQSDAPRCRATLDRRLVPDTFAGPTNSSSARGGSRRPRPPAASGHLARQTSAPPGRLVGGRRRTDDAVARPERIARSDGATEAAVITPRTTAWCALAISRRFARRQSLWRSGAAARHPRPPARRSRVPPPSI